MDGKKSFLLYCDQIGLFEQLPDEQAGKLIKLIFAYVNDEDPEVDDLLLKIAFEPIKLQLKRDLQGWNNIREARSIAGKKGGEASGKARQKKANEASGSESKQSEANEAVTVNDTVTVNDNVTVIDTKVYIPDITEFLDYAKELCLETKKNYSAHEFSFKAKYDSWKDDGWKDGHGNPIKNWKNKLRNTLPFLKPINTSGNITRKEKFQRVADGLKRNQAL